MITDPIGDFLTRIRNAQKRTKDFIELPSSRVLVAIANILKEEGFIQDFESIEQKPQSVLKVYLKYVNKEPAIRELVRVSKPGVRKYRGYKKIKPVKSGLGISIFTTPKGIMTGEEAIRHKIGGEYLCDIY